MYSFKKFKYTLIGLGSALILSSCGLSQASVSSLTDVVQEVVLEAPQHGAPSSSKTKNATLSSIPAYSGEPYIAVNDNVPYFTAKEMTSRSFENYSELDDLGRCGAATSSIGKDLMPTKKRTSISSVKPSGWQKAKYDHVDGKYLYNRCHLIGYQLTAENANAQNLITGTRYLNVDGMLPFENMVADYIKETSNHVLYRVTPLFSKDNLVADGVLMEAKSVEDDGDGILFNVFCYNVQPGVVIDYATGVSKKGDPIAQAKDITFQTEGEAASDSYILNTNTSVFHTADCSAAHRMKKENKKTYNGSRSKLIADGYSPCKKCKP